MGSKHRIAIIFGGRSAEHEVSLQSAKNVIEALDRDKYEPVLIGIDHEGRWYLNDESLFLLDSDDPARIHLKDGGAPVALTPNGPSKELIDLGKRQSAGQVDVIFPVLHGPYGEDGSIQGLAKLADLPCVGAGILGSAVGMDKGIMKRLLRDAGIPVGDFLTVGRPDRDDFPWQRVQNILGSPVFVKPANLGSSVGIHKVSSEEEYREAVRDALQFDRKIILEAFIPGRELECAVLGNDHPVASIVGEIVPKADFYTYAAKYLDDDGAELRIPAELPEDTAQMVQHSAVATFRALDCRGLARVDMFLTEDGQVLVNEINTLPGFTRISMYPKLWGHMGLSYSSLIDKLVELAIEDFEATRRLRSNYEFD
jgi:D-alanine-D-alanine ligase